MSRFKDAAGERYRVTRARARDSWGVAPAADERGVRANLPRISRLRAAAGRDPSCPFGVRCARVAQSPAHVGAEVPVVPAAMVPFPDRPTGAAPAGYG